MYIPTSFAEPDPDTLAEFIESHSFATVISHDAREPVASHLPLLLDRAGGTYGQLIGHMARANRQWEEIDGRRVLVVFHGPHAYVSPTWVEAANAVPTWNYVAVHVYGTFRLDDSPDRRLEIVRRYVEFYESTMESPWSIAAADNDFVESLLEAIVGFRIEIDRMEGKWKLSQNHSPQRRESVANALRDTGDEDGRRIADLMLRTIRK